MSSPASNRLAARPAWLSPVLVGFILTNATLLIGGIAAVRSSPRLDGSSLVPGETCAWSLPPTEAAEVPAERCITRMAGFVPADASLARHPIYLETAEEFELWRDHQRALDAEARGASQLRVEVSAGGAPPAERLLPLRSLSWSDAVYRMLPTGLTALFITGVAGLVLWRRPRERAAQALLVLCQAALVCSLAAMVMAGRGLSLQPVLSIALPAARMIGGIIGLMALIELILVFPVAWLTPEWRRRISAAMVGGLLLSTGAWLAGVFSALMVYTIVLVVLSIGAIAVVTRRIEGTTARLQARWVLWGVAIPIVAWGLVHLPGALGFASARDPSDAVMMLASNAIPLGLGVAILRHKLFDIETYVRRTLIGAVATAGILVAYHGSLALFASELSSTGADSASATPSLLVAFVLIVALMPVQQRLETTLDRTFARNRFHYRQVLHEVADQITSLDEADPAVQRVLQTMVSGVATHRGGVLYTDGESSRCWWVEQGEIVQNDDSKLSTEAWALLREHPDEWLRGHGGPAHSIDSWMAREGLEVLLPLRTSTRTVGLLACGALPGRRLLGRDDIAALKRVAAALTLTLRHAASLQQIRQMNTELESTVQRRTTELSRARVQLYQWEKMASLGALAAGVAHELNTPLGVIRSSADLLRETLPDGRHRRMAGLVGDAARRAADIVTNLRAFSRPERQGLEGLDIRSELEVTLRLLEHRLRQGGVTVEVTHHSPPTIKGYPAMINQTLSNLILNAAEASPTGGVVFVETWPTEAGGVRVQVRDQGDGIPPELLDRIFEPFFTTKGPGGGTGLGLSLCYAFVRQHGGEMTARNAEGAGAVLTVVLPKTPPEELLTDPDGPGLLAPAPS